MLKVLSVVKKGAVEKNAEKKENARNRKNHATREFVQKNAEERKNAVKNPKNQSKIDVKSNAQGTARTANGKKERAET